MGRAYPLLGYLFFLKDMDRFVPVRPSGLDQGLKALGSAHRLYGRCHWANYAEFLEILHEVRHNLEPRVARGSVPIGLRRRSQGVGG